VLDELADSTALLERLVRQILAEKDPEKVDQLGCEIWRALEAHDLLMKKSSRIPDDDRRC
jgi:hypothetical protein